MVYKLDPAWGSVCETQGVKTMTRKSKIFWLLTVLCTGAAFAQVPISGIQAATGPQANKSPVAYVYVNVAEGAAGRTCPAD